MSTYINKAQQRIFTLIEKLSGHELDGISLKDLSDEVGEPVGIIFRDLQNMKEAGWARQVSGRWIMTEKGAIPSERIRKSLSMAMARINQINKDYLGG